VILSSPTRALIELLAIEIADEILREDCKLPNARPESSGTKNWDFAIANNYLNAKDSRE
jgi:hypothetical protein